MKECNFYAGPSILDNGIVSKAIKQISNRENLSVLEISHRSDKIVSLFEETKSLVRDLMNLDKTKEVLFLHGGASLQFAMIPLNIKGNGDAGFIDTGIWSKKAIIEAKKVRNVSIVGSSRDDLYNYIPKIEDYDLSALDYLHLTSNNTIYGTQFFEFPKCETPLVVDMSSDVLSRKLNFNDFDLIFAGFQKNLGTTGGSLVVLDKSILKEGNEDELLSMLDYKVHIKAKSMFNTPSVFSVLMCNLTLKWIMEQGGIDVIEERNQVKAEMLYNEIERNGLFYSYVNKRDRSLMNVCFDTDNEKIEADFLAFCNEQNIIGIKGHRSRGGFRASLYNSMPLESVEYLIDRMKLFEKRYVRKGI